MKKQAKKEISHRFNRAKKSLGQNFLKSKSIISKIVEAGEISEKDIILEIGPGKGILTEKLLEKAKKVIAVEKDDILFDFLKDKFTKEIQKEKLILKHGDILDFNISKTILNNKVGYKIIANIPYNITGAILKKFLSSKTQPKIMVLMVQYEVAKRILAQNKKESILSISVKAYGKPKMIIKVPRRYFSPQPKVDSAIIKISAISKKLFIPKGNNKKHSKKQVNEEIFWKIVHIGFGHKRKILLSNLKKLGNKTNWENKLSHLPKSDFGRIRAEDLSLSDWIKLASMI